LTLYEYPYSDYQKFLISKILDLRSQGWNDPQISKWFNENNIKKPLVKTPKKETIKVKEDEAIWK